MIERKVARVVVVIDVGVIGQHVDADRLEISSWATVSGSATGASLLPLTVITTVCVSLSGTMIEPLLSVAFRVYVSFSDSPAAR